jgi:phage terminase large subunit-like protein
VTEAYPPLGLDARVEREHLLAIAEELKKRREGDPLRTYQLHSKQRAFVTSVLERKAPENWFIAANRSGKSDAGAYTGASLARFGVPSGKVQVNADGTASSVQVSDRATSGWVSALDFPTSRDVIQPKYFDNGFVPGGQKHPPFIPAHEIADWRVDDQILKLKNGSLIGFKSADSGRRKYQGAEKDWVHMDEEHPWEIYEEMVIRVGARPLLFFCTATILPPEGINTTTSWVFSKVIQPWKMGKLQHAALFGASIYDNPGIARDEISRLESIYPLGSLSRRIRLEGEWLPGIGGARAYASFQRELHVREQPELSMRRPLCWTWDFNVEPMVSLVGQVDGGLYRVHKEIVLDEGNIPEMCEMFRMHFPRHEAEIWLYGDATSERRIGQTGKSDYFVIMQEMRNFNLPIKMRVPPENPRVADRVNSVNRLCKDEKGLIRLQVDPSCMELIADLEGVLRDQKGGIFKVRNKKDPYFRRTHTSDALGYWISYEEPVQPPSEHIRRNVTIASPSYGFGRRR